MIPTEAVDAAARATFERSFSGTSATWDHIAEVGRQDYLQQARAALEAAFPYLMSGVLDECDKTDVETSEALQADLIGRIRETVRRATP